jgi:hypothetical protein
VVVMVGGAFDNARWGSGLGQKTKTKPLWLGFSSAMLNGHGEMWWVVVGWLIQDDSSCRAARARKQHGGEVGAKNPKPSAIAQFWAAYRH